MHFRLQGHLSVLVCCAALGSTALAADVVRLTAEQRKASAVRVETVTSSASGKASTVSLQGFAVLPPQAVETVSAPLSGFVQSVLVAPTDRLRAGQTVAQMHSTELMQWQREFVQLESQAQQSQDRLQRSERLLADGIVAESRVREDRYANTQAQVAMKERRQALQMAGMSEGRVRTLSEKSAVQAQLSVSTPREGTVIEVMATPGQRVEAGAPLLKLARSGMLALELQATPTQSLSIATGAAVSVNGCAKPGRVRGLGALVRGGNQAVTVHVDMPSTQGGSACLRPNQAVTAEVAAGASDGNTHASNVGVSVPTRALFQHGGTDHVFVQEGDAFRVTPVQVLSRQGERAQLSSGVNSGASVVTQGISTLKAAWLGMGEDTAGKP